MTGSATARSTRARSSPGTQDTGELTIRLAATGRPLTGTVEDRSDVSCDTRAAYASGASRDDDADDDDEADAQSSADESLLLSGYETDDNAAEDDESGGSVTLEEACFSDVLARGRWVHEAALTSDGNWAT